MPIGLNAVVDRGMNTAISRRLGLSAEATVSLMPELGPVLQLGTMPEMDFHMGWRKYMSAGQQPAGGAAQFGTIRFRMPRIGVPGADIMCIIESVYMGLDTAIAPVEVKVAGIIATTDLTVPLGAQVRDNLQAASLPGQTQVSRGTQADQGIGAGGLYLTTQTVPNVFPLVLRPSLIAGTALDGWQFQFSVANVNVNFGIIWRERKLNEQENVP